MSNIALVFLSALLIFWGLPLSSATGRLRRFYLINDTEMLINEAQNVCRRDYTDLVTIYDKKENMELVNILKHLGGWIGASSCKWSNGDPATFTNISTTFIEENCGAINTDGSWDFFTCNSTKYFICYKQGHGQESYNYSLIRENRTWFEAQLYCRENHTDLVSIRDETENEQVKVTVNGSNSWIWIGLQYNYSLHWLDGGHSDYIHEFNPRTKGCFTYLIKANPEYWFKKNENKLNALCYKSFINVSENSMSWEESLDSCGKHTNTTGLLTIHSENDQIETERELRRRNITGPVWVGLRQSRLFGFWIWINGLHVGNYSNWKGGSPPEHQMSEHCGAIEKVHGQYKWVDKDCRNKYRFLCERK